MRSQVTSVSAVLDTDVLSFTFKEDTRGILYRSHLEGRQLTISFMTVAELERWALVRRWGQRRRAELDQYLRQFLVQHSDPDLCRWWAAVMVSGQRQGRPIQVADAWIAATALLYDLPLITHNPADYAGVDGLRLITEAGR